MIFDSFILTLIFNMFLFFILNKSMQLMDKILSSEDKIEFRFSVIVSILISLGMVATSIILVVIIFFFNLITCIMYFSQKAKNSTVFNKINSIFEAN